MPNMLSERANAYRGALRQGLNDGLSIQISIELAKKAARDAGNTPQQKPPVELTDAELRLIDENELTEEESNRLHELEQAEDMAEGDYCINCGIPTATHGDECGQDTTSKSDAVKEMAEALGYRVIEMGNFGADNWREQEMAKAELADAWRDAVGVVTPAGLRMTAKANFMAGLGEALDEVLNPGCTDRELGEMDPEFIKACDDGGPYNEPRDCDIPATLRAVHLFETEDNSQYRLWFDGDDEVNQFLAGRKLYASSDRTIKNLLGDTVGMWFYAHFGPTPTS